ncbi:MAG: adenylate/guanylate cyclase domain-containing protein [Saprospiraceae bacterium]|nr:adenylate/guanylate cyclase domain-containing protein [Saprospiraceae bacterium]
MQRTTGIKLQTVGVITLAWILFSTLLFFFEYTSYQYRSAELVDTFNLPLEFGLTLLSCLLAGIVGGSLLVFNLDRGSKRRPFYFGIISTALYFLIIYFGISAIISLIALSIEQTRPIFSSSVVKAALVDNMFSSFQIRNVLVWTCIVVATQFMLQINDRFGPGNLWKIFRAKYHTPKEELRVFMFLDMKSSTSIAEEFGHKKYYLFLNEFYSVISDTIINRYGEIYQYVGDEIVISWTAENAVRDQNCLYCYFDIRKVIEQNHEIFKSEYKRIPDFRAGIHFGPVTVGEIGNYKRDIVFTGDVMNTTARIQEACKAYEADLLISENALSLFDNTHPFAIDVLDEIELRGKEKRVHLYALSLDGAVEG